MIALWLALAAAAGYTTGHYRLPARAFERAYDWSQTGSWYSEPVAALMLLGAVLFTPWRVVRGVRSWRRRDERLPAPQMDPNWGKR